MESAEKAHGFNFWVWLHVLADQFPYSALNIKKFFTSLKDLIYFCRI